MGSLTEDNTNTYNTYDSHDDHHLEESGREKKVGVVKKQEGYFSHIVVLPRLATRWWYYPRNRAREGSSATGALITPAGEFK